MMNKYQQIKVLGEGGFGKAILARQRSDNSQYVIKEVRLSSLSVKDRNEATKEAKVLSSLNHPNIVKYTTSFQERGCFYIVMEYCDGGDLSKKIAGQGSVLFSEDQILHYFIQIALAIKYIHDRKILHRDLKAQNIFLTKDGTVKLGDFGIARVLEHTFQLCRTQIGTPYYLSPEICEGKNYNAKTDIWSLGCILYELCTLKRAFEGCDQKGILMKIVRGKYAPISSKYSQDLRNLVDAMLTKDVNKRPSINEILKRPFIQSRLNSMLEKTILDYEFSHTIIHGRKPFAAPTVLISKNEEKSNQNLNEKNDQNKFKVSNQNLQFKNQEKGRSPSEQRLIDQNFLKEQQRKKEHKESKKLIMQHKNYPANVDPRYARRNYDVFGNARDPKYVANQEKERQKQIDDLKRRHQQDENERKAREQQNERVRQSNAMNDDMKRVSAEREKQRLKLEQQRRELEEMQRLADEQKRQEEAKRKAVMEDLRRQEEEYKRRKEEIKQIMRNHEREEERRQAEEIERRRLEEVERKRKEVEEMVKKRKAEADELKRYQEQKRQERMLEQQREREQLEADRRKYFEQQKVERLERLKKQREIREQQKRDLEERRNRNQREIRQMAIEQKPKPQNIFAFTDSDDDSNDIRGGYSYNDKKDPLEETTTEDFLNKVANETPAWAKGSAVPIQIAVDEDEDEDELGKVQSDGFFQTIKSGTIFEKVQTPAWCRQNAKSDNEAPCDDPLGYSIIDKSPIPAWAKNRRANRAVESFPDLDDGELNNKFGKSSSTSRLLPEKIINPYENISDEDEYDGELGDNLDDSEFDEKINQKFIDEDNRKLSSLHDLAMTIKQAIDMNDESPSKPDGENEDDVDDAQNNNEQIFFLNDEQIRLPVANDKNSLAKRQEAITKLLEEKIGPETLIALYEELIQREADDNIQTPIINNLPPGIVCLAQQWLMLDATSKDD